MRIFLAMILAMCIVGCTTPQQGAYKTLAAVGMSVDKAMYSIAAAKKAGKVSDDDWYKIRVLKLDFNAAYTLACDMAGYDYGQFAPEQLLVIQSRLLETIDSIMKKK